MPSPVRPTAGILLAVAVLAAGCSVGRYDADYAEAVAAFEERAPFAVLRADPAKVGSGSFMLRLPAGFLPLSPPPPPAEGQPAARLDPSRLRPPFLPDFPGYDQTFERRFVVGNVEYPWSLAIGVIPSATQPRRQVEALLADKARADESFAGQKPAWEDREVVAVEGGPTAWRVLSLPGQQVFETVVAGNEEHKRRAGVCEFWLAADPDCDQQLLLAWRYPDEVVELMPVTPPQLAKTVARTVAVTAGDEDQGGGGAAAPAPPSGADGEQSEPEPDPFGSSPADEPSRPG